MKFWSGLTYRYRFIHIVLQVGISDYWNDMTGPGQRELSGFPQQSRNGTRSYGAAARERDAVRTCRLRIRQEPDRSQGWLREFLTSPSILRTYYRRSAVAVQHWTSLKQIGWRLMGLTCIHHNDQKCTRVNIPALRH